MSKTKKKEKIKNQILSYNQLRLRRVLESLGIYDLYRNTYLSFREFFIKNFDYTPTFHLPEDCPEEIEVFVNDIPKIKHRGINLFDCYEMLVPLRGYVQSTLDKVPHSKFKTQTVDLSKVRDYKILLSELEKALDEIKENLNDTVSKELLCLLVENSSLEEGFYTCKVTYEIERNFQHHLRFEIEKKPSEQKQLFIETHNRRAYRVGGMVVKGKSIDFEWLALSPNLLRLPGVFSEKLPVYIQPHAIFRAKERLDHPVIQKEIGYWISESLRNPEVTEIPGNNVLLALKMGVDDIKLGYLVLSKIPGAIIVKTFLFLTMDTTPENHRLNRRLRLQRLDFEHLQLTKLSTFLESDIVENETLVEVFKQSGLEPFINWIKKVRVDENIRPIANNLVNYLMLKPKLLDIVKNDQNSVEEKSNG